MATAPTLTNYQQSTWSGTSSASEVTAALSWTSGDWIFVLGATDDNIQTLNTPTATGLTFTLVTSTNTGSKCKVYLWTAQAASTSSGAITATVGGGTAARGLAAWSYSGSDGIGNNSVSAALGATTTQSLIRGSDNSAVIQVWGDFNAINDTTVTWTPSGQTQRVAQFVSGQFTAFVADWGDQGAAGTTSYGFSGFAGGNMSALTVEVKGAAGGGATGHPTMRRWGGVPFMGGFDGGLARGGGGSWSRTDSGIYIPNHLRKAA